MRRSLSRLAHHHGCLVAAALAALAACTGTIGDAGPPGAIGAPGGGGSVSGGPDGSTAQALVCTGAVDTGATPLERLTRNQYGNVVRDLLGLQTAFDGKVRIAFSDKVQRPGENDCGQTAEHDRRENLREQFPMRQVHDFRVTDRQRNRSFANASRHDRNDDEEEGMVSPQSQRHAYGRTNGPRDD